MSTETSKPMVAVIGCGYWGQHLVRNFSELGHLHAICDEDASTAEQFATRYKVRNESFEEILGDESIEGVVIGTPAVTHAEVVEESLKAGKHVFVEKPLALNPAEAEKLRALSLEREKVLMVGHLLQYHPAFLKLRQLVADGELGRLLHIHSHRLNFGKIRREENILWSFAPHDVSMILSLTGSEPIEISSMGGCYLQEGITDVTTTHLRFVNGVNAHIFVSWLHPFKEQKLVVVGEDGMAVFDDTKDWGNKLILYPHAVNWSGGTPDTDKADAIPVPVSSDEPLKLEAGHFLECISEGIACRTDSAEAIRVLKVLHASEIAMTENRVISMKEAGSAGRGKDSNYFKHESACIDEGCTIGDDTRIWHFSHILSGSRIGRDCVIGQNVMIGPDVSVGERCKIQNNVSLYKGVILKDGVFCGPSCVFTNVINPRAEIERKNEFRETVVNNGVTIGANATILCGIEIGEYGFIAAGAVVTSDVKPYSIVRGMPARHSGWTCRCGEILEVSTDDGVDTSCSKCGENYTLKNGELRKSD